MDERDRQRKRRRTKKRKEAAGTDVPALAQLLQSLVPGGDLLATLTQLLKDAQDRKAGEKGDQPAVDEVDGLAIPSQESQTNDQDNVLEEG